MRLSASEGWQGNCNKVLEGCKIVNVMFLRKFKKPISCFQIKVFFIVFFSVFLLCSLLFIRNFDYHQNNKVEDGSYHKASNINKIITYNYEIMAKLRYDAILNFLKNYLSSSYLGVILFSCNIKDNFCFT